MGGGVQEPKSPCVLEVKDSLTTFQVHSLCNVLVMGVKVSEDPDAQCTRKHRFNGARQKESQQAGRGR